MNSIITYGIIFVVLLACELIYFKIADKCNIIDKPNDHCIERRWCDLHYRYACVGGLSDWMGRAYELYGCGIGGGVSAFPLWSAADSRCELCG